MCVYMHIYGSHYVYTYHLTNHHPKSRGQAERRQLAPNWLAEILLMAVTGGPGGR